MHNFSNTSSVFNGQWWYIYDPSSELLQLFIKQNQNQLGGTDQRLFTKGKLLLDGQAFYNF